MAYKIFIGMSKVKRKYQAYSDGGHGWLKVKKAELYRLGIADKISGYSYQRGDNAYLEEDSDLTTFYNAKKQRNEPLEIELHESNKSSKIRNYEGFKG